LPALKIKGNDSYGAAIGWYGSGPLARKIQHLQLLECAKSFSAEISNCEIERTDKGTGSRHRAPSQQKIHDFFKTCLTSLI
jgi:hypothetical protein